VDAERRGCRAVLLVRLAVDITVSIDALLLNQRRLALLAGFGRKLDPIQINWRSSVSIDSL
jgi:hypothetical protein